jgi:hypothetical protein
MMILRTMSDGLAGALDVFYMLSEFRLVMHCVRSLS